MPRPRPSKKVPVISHLSHTMLDLAGQAQRSEKNALREARNVPAKSWLRESRKRQAAFHRGMKMGFIETARRDLKGFNPELRKQRRKISSRN